jgi:DNA mismatch repair protein MutL
VRVNQVSQGYNLGPKEVGLPIHTLSEDVAAAIAAGEVVERPESVVKELVENAIDAGAGRIEIRVEGGGRSLVEVGDDGCGIPASELPLAVARYATSKLATAEDLFAIETLGFRGEALSSIGAVSRLEISTAAQDAEVGSRLTVEGGEIDDVEPVGAPQGTIVRVRDLFYNVPARRKFLKTERTENRRINRLITRYAMAYPRIAFQLIQDDRHSFQSSGRGELREVLADVFGVEIGKKLISLPAASKEPIRVRGFISPPTVNRSNRSELTFFVNGRWVQDASLSAAVLQAYHTFLMVGRYPIAVILIELPPEQVDVNVHPAKAEVRFREQRRVFSVVQRNVRATLMGQSPAPEVTFPTGWRGGDPEGSTELARDWLFAQRGFDGESSAPERRLQPALPGDLPLLRAVGQVGASYLVAEGPDGLYLIDQHAAHERILFESFQEARRQNELEAQTLLEPVTVEFPPDQADLMQEHAQVMDELGFEVEPFGRRAYRIRAIPSMLAKLDPEQALRTLVEDFEEDESPLASELEARLVARICKRAAVKAGQVLSIKEQQQLIRDLESCRSPRTCPHGRPTMIHLSVEALERQFGRRGP